MRRSWVRRLAVVGVVPLTSFAVLVAGTAPANAWSSLASQGGMNAAIVSELGATAINTAATLPYDPVLEAELTTAAAATTTTAARPGTKVKPKAGGKLGLIINSVAMLGGLAMMWDGEGSPALPAPGGNGPQPASDTVCTVTVNGVATTYKVFTSAGGEATMSCSASFVQIGGTGVSGRMFRVDGTPTSICSQCPYTRLAGNAAGQLPDTGTRIYEHWSGGTSTYGTGTLTAKSWVNAPAVATPPATGSDPAVIPRYIETTITCKSAGGGSQVLTSRTPSFTFNPAGPAELPEAPDTSCPAGTWLDSGKREIATEGSTEKVLLTEPYVAPAWVPQQVTDHPGCFPASGTKCQLELVKIATTPELYCNKIPVGSGGHACRDWMTDPNKLDRYECRFGGTAVALRRCEPYANSYKPAQTQVLSPTPANPDAAPTPAPAPGSDPTPGETPELSGCTPEWADLLSPWWVFKATSCALSWAFIPPTGHLDAKASEVRAEWDATTPGLWIGHIDGMVTVPDGNCGGIPVNFDIAGGVGVDMQLGEACSGSMATTANLVKLAITGFMCVGGAFAGVRILGAGFGWAPAIGKGADT